MASWGLWKSREATNWLHSRKNLSSSADLQFLVSSDFKLRNIQCFYLGDRSESESSKMAFNNNKGEPEFPFEIKEAEGAVREQFMKDFHGK